MRLSVFMFAVVATLASAAGAARAASSWYVSGDLGGYFRQDTEVQGATRQTLFVPVTRQVAGSPTPVVAYVPETVMSSGRARRRFDPGLVGHLAVGYRWGSRIRIEAEAGAAGYDAGRTSLGLGGSNALTAFNRLSGGQTNRESVGLNAFYDFRNLSAGFVPYVGLGAGAAWDRAGSGIFDEANGRRLLLAGGGATQGFALVEAGVNLPLSRHWSIAPAYRYLRDLGGRGQAEEAHIAKMGLRYAF